MKREKIIKEFEGQRLHVEKALGGRVDRSQQDIFETQAATDAYWYGRLVGLEDMLRLLREPSQEIHRV